MGSWRCTCTPIRAKRRVQLILFDCHGRFYRLHYLARDTRAGSLWFDEVNLATRSKLQLKDTWRVYNAPGGPTTNDLRAAFGKCAEKINLCRPGTLPLWDGLLAPADAPLEEQQQRLNDAHVHFEHMMGSADCPSEFFESASTELRALVQEYNLRLHALEDNLRQQERRLQGLPIHTRIVVTFDGRRRELLTREELCGFVLDRKFGVAYLNYCQVGKHLLEACQDNDFVTGAIRPQAKRSADTLLWFGTNPSAQEMCELDALVSKWYERGNMEKIFPRCDPASALGYLPVADLCRNEADVQGLNEEQIVQLLGGTTIHSFRTLE